MELATLVRRSAKLEAENAQLKDTVQHMKVTAALRTAQLGALEESANFHQLEVHRHQQREEEQLLLAERDRAQPLYPRFLHLDRPSFRDTAANDDGDGDGDGYEKQHDTTTASMALALSPHQDFVKTHIAEEESKADHDKELTHNHNQANTSIAPSSNGGSSEMTVHGHGTSAATRGLYDDLHATRRQLDGLSLLSAATHSHSSAIHISTATKQAARDSARAAAAGAIATASHLSTARSADVSALSAIARGDYFRSSMDADAGSNRAGDYRRRHMQLHQEQHGTSRSFDASVFNDTMDRITQLGGPSSAYHHHLTSVSTSARKESNAPVSTQAFASFISQDEMAGIYKPLQLPSFGLAPTTPSNFNAGRGTGIGGGGAGMTFYSQYSPAVAFIGGSVSLSSSSAPPSPMRPSHQT